MSFQPDSTPGTPREQGDAVRLEFYDNGAGISRENLLKIFERFKQLDENNNRLYNGNGIGLAICRGLLELMEGKIWAVSKESGSEFYFSLPLKSLEFKQLAESEDTLFA